MVKIDFYYWGEQCPHNCKMRMLLEKYSNYKECKISFFDISGKQALAKKLNIFSPNMMIINDNIRWHGPISCNVVESILSGTIPEGKPYYVEMSNDVVKGDIKDLTESTVKDTCMLCASSKKNSYCGDKSKWILEIRDEFNLPHLGKLHYLKGECIGGAEFVPSKIVPYPIPRAEDLAFLTCSFGTSEKGDFKSYPLQKLEEDLIKLGYKSIIAIVSEDTPFPNGPLQWFIAKGFEDLGFIYYEERHFAKMHLVLKTMNANELK